MHTNGQPPRQGRLPCPESTQSSSPSASTPSGSGRRPPSSRLTPSQAAAVALVALLVAVTLVAVADRRPAEILLLAVALPLAVAGLRREA